MMLEPTPYRDYYYRVAIRGASGTTAIRQNDDNRLEIEPTIMGLQSYWEVLRGTEGGELLETTPLTETARSCTLARTVNLPA